MFLKFLVVVVVVVVLICVLGACGLRAIHLSMMIGIPFSLRPFFSRNTTSIISSSANSTYAIPLWRRVTLSTTNLTARIGCCKKSISSSSVRERANCLQNTVLASFSASVKKVFVVILGGDDEAIGVVAIGVLVEYDNDDEEEEESLRGDFDVHPSSDGKIRLCSVPSKRESMYALCGFIKSSSIKVCIMFINKK